MDVHPDELVAMMRTVAEAQAAYWDVLCKLERATDRKLSSDADYTEIGDQETTEESIQFFEEKFPGS